MSTKRIVVHGGKNDRDHHFDLVTEGNNRGDNTVTLKRSGQNWTEEYKGSKSVEIVSDGNGISVAIFRDSTGKYAHHIKLDYAEAEELGIALLEYTRQDPYCPDPIYTTFENPKPEPVTRVVRKAAKKKTRKQLRKENDRIYKNDKYGMGG